jgi:hypothetical protein
MLTLMPHMIDPVLACLDHLVQLSSLCHVLSSHI